MSRKSTNNTLSNIKLTNNDVHNTTQKTLRNTNPTKKIGENSGAPEGKSFPAPLMATVVLHYLFIQYNFT